ncbi:DUF5134 domain-containing protein [Prauserella oleivorans]
MQIPAIGWALTVAFLALTLPCVSRLVRLDYARLGAGVRHIDLAGLLMTLAMVAMVSPVGGPIPIAGWQALFLLTAGWFLAAPCAIECRRACAGVAICTTGSPPWACCTCSRPCRTAAGTRCGPP